MPYTVFALKWRPQKFDDIIGQPHVVTALKSALEKGKLSHAYLFAGPRGVGKTSTARIMAKSLNCARGATVTPCQECASCKDITQGRSLDVIEIDGASNRGIDEIRTLRENVKFSPASGKYKIYIIDEVHMLTSEAFNALLKTLEEPPPFVKFIFATTHPHKILPTILSRCQRLDFRRIPVLEMIAQLEKIASAEKLSVDKEVLAAIARSSDGSLRDAESIFDQVASFSEGKVALSDVVSVLGIVDQDVLSRITDAIIRKSPHEAITVLNTVIDQGKDIGVFLHNLIEHFRNLMVAKITKGDASLIDLPQEICARLLKQSEQMSLEEIFNAFNTFVSAQEMAKRIDSLRIPLEVSLVRLAYKKVDVAQVDSRPVPPVISRNPPVLLSQESRGGEAISSPSSSPPAAAAPAVSLEALHEAWQGIVSRLEKVKISVATYLNEGEAVKIQGCVVTIAFPKNLSLHKDALEMKENKAIVEKAVSEALKATLRVTFILSAEAAKQSPGVKHETFIKSTLDMFEGRILKEE